MHSHIYDHFFQLERFTWYWEKYDPYVAWYTAKFGGRQNDPLKPSSDHHSCDHVSVKGTMLPWRKPTYTRPPTLDVLSSTILCNLWARDMAMPAIAVNFLVTNRLISPDMVCAGLWLPSQSTYIFFQLLAELFSIVDGNASAELWSDGGINIAIVIVL